MSVPKWKIKVGDKLIEVQAFASGKVRLIEKVYWSGRNFTAVNEVGELF